MQVFKWSLQRMEKSDFKQSEFIRVKTNFNKLNYKVWVLYVENTAEYLIKFKIFTLFIGPIFKNSLKLIFLFFEKYFSLF